jgi:hypothetical protein
VSNLRGLNFSSLLNKKKKCVRIKRKKLIHTIILKSGAIAVIRLIPWIRIGKNYAWMVSLAVGKSRRQINDWLKRRSKRKRVQKLNINLTGLGGNSGQAIALRQLYVWLAVIPKGDMIMFYCESADAERQMMIWKKWILRHNSDLLYSIDEETKSFYIYKSMSLE